LLSHDGEQEIESFVDFWRGHLVVHALAFSAAGDKALTFQNRKML
jgi:hypothetical protein